MAFTVGVNSYESVGEADSFLSTHVKYSRWSGLASGQKENYLIQACEDIEQFSENYVGWRYDSGQRLSFPRTLISGDSDFENITPSGVKEAQSLQAIWLVSNYDRREEREDMETLGIQQIDVDSTTEKRSSIKFGVCKEALRKISIYVRNKITKRIYRS